MGVLADFCLLAGITVVFAPTAVCKPPLLCAGYKPLSRLMPAKAAFCIFDHAL